MQNLSLNLCVSDIPKQFVRKGKNGKFYVNLLVVQRKEIDHFGNTHTVKISKTAEELQLDTANVYVGSGKVFEIKETTADKVSPEELPEFMRDAVSSDAPEPIKEVPF
ncbi:MAG: hypothetical protein LBS50_08645 [Prevotellaceae bacterium]|jgi:hypothetical protein|nr:hypothetical protein [Prevotellaceae bacterium]